MAESLQKDKEYPVFKYGDFIIQTGENSITITLTSDANVMQVQPNADNKITVRSEKSKYNTIR